MIYLSWAILYEGTTDQAYYDLLIPRVMEEIVRLHGTTHSTIPPDPAIRLTRGPVERVAREACGARDAFQLAFIHADAGGRHLEATLDHRSTHYCQAMHESCGWHLVRCVTITPRHETEAWLLADPEAVCDALGYRGPPDSVGLPVNAREAECISDPKAVLEAAVRKVRGRRRTSNVTQIFAAIAQRQRFERLRNAHSFASFERNLTAALADLGCVSSDQ